MITFGPLISRRLGYSLGVNHIPAKYCTYDCIYCQVGPTHPLTITRQPFYETETIIAEVKQALEDVAKQGKHIDVITFVPDGEPGLDVNLGAHLRALKPLGIKLAIISNGSLLREPAVVEDFCLADWVSVKVDSVGADTWHKINRPYGRLRLEQVLDGITQFADIYQGELVTETLLVAGVNDSLEELTKTANFIRSLQPGCAYLSLPIRPPMETWVTAPRAERITAAHQIFKQNIKRVEVLGLVQPQPFVGQKGIQEAVLATAAVHPLDEQTVQGMLDEAGADWGEIDMLVNKALLVKTEFNGQVFFITDIRK